MGGRPGPFYGHSACFEGSTLLDKHFATAQNFVIQLTKVATIATNKRNDFGFLTMRPSGVKAG